VTKVFLLSSFADPADDTHWASPYHALRRAFGEQRSANSVLVDSPVDADLILICPRARNPVFPTEIFRDGIAWKYRHKCVVVSTDDNPTMTHKGFYTSKRASATRSPWLKGGFYPLVAYALPEAPFPLDADFRHLFSFRGSFATHPVRRRIGMLADAASPEEALRFLVVDTSQPPRHVPVQRSTLRNHEVWPGASRDFRRMDTAARSALEALRHIHRRKGRGVHSADTRAGGVGILGKSAYGATSLDRLFLCTSTAGNREPLGHVAA
jgi:hypothetical protein